jgi:ribosome production factor 2
VRTFGYKILDMLELNLDATSFRRMSEFKTRKVAVGQRPLLVFSGTAFESPVANEWTTAKSLLIDFFRGDNADKLDVEGIQHVVCISAEEPGPLGGADGADATKPALHIRTYLIRTKRSTENKRLPLVELEEMGPRMTLRPGRCREADAGMLKEAMRKGKTNEERTKKNISTDSMGDKLGRIHVGKQDVAQLQTRKMKGLKRSRDAVDEEAARPDIEEVVGDDAPKRKRKV